MNAYITGADRGLGAALAEELLKRGFVVFAGKYGIEDIYLNKLIERYGAQMQVLALDVSCDKSVAEASKKLKSKIGKLDLLINNAGILGDFDCTLTDELDFEDMKQTYNINALGPLRVTRSVFELIAKSKLKKIVNISSEAGSIQKSVMDLRTTRYGYCMSKSALNNQSVMVQNHAAQYGIKVYAMEPGWVRTYLRGEKNMEAKLEPEESAAQILKTVLDKNPPEYLFMDLYGNKFQW